MRSCGVLRSPHEVLLVRLLHLNGQIRQVEAFFVFVDEAGDLDSQVVTSGIQLRIDFQFNVHRRLAFGQFHGLGELEARMGAECEGHRTVKRWDPVRQNLELERTAGRDSGLSGFIRWREGTPHIQRERAMNMDSPPV